MDRPGKVAGRVKPADGALDGLLVTVGGECGGGTIQHVVGTSGNVVEISRASVKCGRLRREAIDRHRVRQRRLAFGSVAPTTIRMCWNRKRAAIQPDIVKIIAGTHLNSN